MNPSPILSAVVFFLYGAVAIVGQLLYLEELVILFAGNELFLGFSLAAWMGWVGAGSWLARKMPVAKLGYAASGLIPLFIVNLILIRLSKCLFGFGMLVGLLPMLTLTTILLAPMGLVIGIIFTSACAWADNRSRFPIGAAYLWDTLGSAAGGMTYCWLIAGKIPPQGTIVLLAVLSSVLCAVVIRRYLFKILAATAALALAFFFALSPLAHWTRAMQWRGYSMIGEHTSRYSHLVLARVGSLVNLFSNGVISAHFPDPAAYEELVHWPLLIHSAPRRILVIGGGATGTLAEILKHPVARVDYVEIDKSLIEMLKPVLPEPDRAALDDSRVRILHCDGRVLLAKTHEIYDVILLQLPEPSTAQINRLYTREAFEAIRNRLAPGGIFAFAIPSSENYMSAQTIFFNACLYKTLKAVFDNVELVAGDPLLLLAGATPLRLDAEALASRYRQRNLKTREVVPSYFPIRLNMERRSGVIRNLNSLGLTIVNRDFVPVCYAYAWRLWLSKFVTPLYFLGTVLLLVLLLFLLRALWRRRTQLCSLTGPTVLFFLGGAGILYETVLILAFQSISGYVYWQLGTLFAAFMVGLALGSMLAVYQLGHLDNIKAGWFLRGLLAVTGLEGLFLAWILPAFSRLPLGIPWLIPFGLLLLITGLWLGIAFPVAGKISPLQTAGKTAGTLYAADLWGAAVGALITSTFLIPLIGLCQTAAAQGILLTACAVVLRKQKK